MANQKQRENAEDEYFCAAAPMQRFIQTVQAYRASESDPAKLVERLKPAFSELLSDQDWLPSEFCAPNPEGGMGGGIATWLLFRSAAADLTLMSLVVPAGSQTPIHDHLAWGLVGLYRGAQDEDVYGRTDNGDTEGTATLSLVQQRRLAPLSFYELLPPDGDIHRVRTAGIEASVSIHLLGNDVGCVLRHSFEPAIDAVAEFRSGYSNVACDEAAP
jgi:predicted metal-dependent enzyme (double-stranded beta helix superfamily)